MTIAVPILYNVNSELPKSGRIFTENVKIENGSCNFKKNGVSYRKRRHTLFCTFGYMGILNEDVPKDYFWNFFYYIGNFAAISYVIKSSGRDLAAAEGKRAAGAASRNCLKRVPAKKKGR